MIPTVPNIDYVLAYALGRRAIITQACGLIDTLGIPLTEPPDDLDTDLGGLVNLWAVGQHPDVTRFYLEAAEAAHDKCRSLLIDEGIEKVAHLEALVGRDVELLARALELFDQLPAEIQDQVRRSTERSHTASVLKSPARMVSAAPAILLVAWDREWRDAIDQFAEFAGPVIQSPPAIEDYRTRIENLEESVEMIINRFVAISAAAEIPSEQGQRR